MSEKKRCPWAERDPLERDYHDYEWGVPVHNDQHLFEMLILEGAQAGLSWTTVLRKRDTYRQALGDFDPLRIAQYDQQKIETLLSNPGIIRNRQKIQSTIINARAFLEIQQQWGSFDAYIWSFVDGKPIRNAWRSFEEIPATHKVSDAMSKELKKRGFKFVGPTICYAFMQAVGMVNDHLVGCFRYSEIDTD